MTHSVTASSLYAQNALAGLIVIAPVGAYKGRVLTGIDLVLGSQAAATTRADVVLVVSNEWAQDPAYRKNLVDSVQQRVIDTWKREAGLDIRCKQVTLPIENEDHVAGWLLKELTLFFKTFKGDAEAFVDLTSGPKEWHFAALNISDFFSNLELYYVRPSRRLQYEEYSPQQIEDRGLPRLEIVRGGHVQEPLPKWVASKGAGGTRNPQYLLYETIFQHAKRLVADKGSTAIDQLSSVLIPIKGAFLDEYRRVLEQKRMPKFRDDAALMKSISKQFNAIMHLGLFERHGNSIRMTFRGAMLGQALFSEIDNS